MAKAYHANKQPKKKALLSPKEKKAKRLEKKQALDAMPPLVPVTNSGRRT